MKKFLLRLLILTLSLTAVFLSGCETVSGESEKESLPPINFEQYVEIGENTVVITVSSEVMDITSKTVLVDYMNLLKEAKVLDFGIKDGMVNSINGKENPADWSACWMLYTNDTEFANTEWGTVIVDGVIYPSAVLGAESLPIKDGKVYVWEYKTF